jgi:hypothetical protein
VDEYGRPVSPEFGPTKKKYIVDDETRKKHEFAQINDSKEELPILSERDIDSSGLI